MHDIPVISVVGRQNAGKTLTASQMVRYWREKGMKIAVVKHDGHAKEGVDWEKPGSDTERFGEAGAIITMVAGGGQSLLRLRTDPSSEDLSVLVSRVVRAAESDGGSGLDIVVAEGFKSSTAAKVVVVQDTSDVLWLQEGSLHPILAVVGPTSILDSGSLQWNIYDETAIGALCEDVWNELHNEARLDRKELLSGEQI